MRARRYVSYSSFLLYINKPSFSGLSPSIHSIDQIKVVDRFRGILIVIQSIVPSFDRLGRNTTRGSHGRLGVVGP